MSTAKDPSQNPGDEGPHTRLKRNSSKRYSRVIPVNLRPVSDAADTAQKRTSVLSMGCRSPSNSDDFFPGSPPSRIDLGPRREEASRSRESIIETDGRPLSPYSTHGHRATSVNERIIELRGTGKHSWMPPINQLDAQPGTSLIVRRIQKTKERQSEEAQKQSQSGLRELQQSFVARQPVDSNNWEFWASVVGDYATVARTQSDKLRRAIQEGFPSEIRGLLWQIIASSKSSTLEHLYGELSKVEDPPCKTTIAKDLDRTPMAKRVDRDALNRLLCAYSIFDPEVGYTQGMAFVAVPLLLELHEPEAFSMFVQLMKTYEIRTVYLADMPGLHLKLYQFDRLIEDILEPVHTHLRRQGVQSTMYASQWFLTMFAYRFPPSLVTRIFDITIAEGLEALLRFAVALMEAAAPTILSLEGLDQLLPFLKEKIFDQFDGSENELVRLASQLDLLPQVLSKFELEYQELNRLEKERIEQLDVLRTSNARLTLQNRNLEATLETLNGEHVQIVNKMIEKRWELAHLQDENEELKQELAKSNDKHSSLGEVSSKLEAVTSEMVNLKHDNEQMQEELALLRKSQDITSTAKLIQEIKELREVNKRYATQLGSLQESLASALEIG